MNIALDAIKDLIQISSSKSRLTRSSLHDSDAATHAMGRCIILCTDGYRVSLLSKELSIDSALAPDAARDRVLNMVAARLLIDTPRYRFYNARGWVLEEHEDTIAIRLETWSIKSSYGARFIGVIEPVGFGSRIAGRVVIHWLTKIIIIGFSVATAIAPFLIFIQGVPALSMSERIQETLKAIAIAIGMIAAAMLLVRFSVVSTANLIRDGLRRALTDDAIQSP